MTKEKIIAGSEVQPGKYRCNACANEYECREEGEKLPMCSVCDSVSWRQSQRFSPDSKSRSEGGKGED